MAQGQDSLAYDLLLQKSSQKSLDRAPSIDNASTEDPDGSSVSSVAEPVRTFIPARSAVVFLRNVQIHGQHADARVVQLIGETRKLSETVFDEDCLQEVTKKSHWKLTLLATDDFSMVCGFLVWKIVNGALSIAKLAVPSELRGSGFGKLIMEDAIKGAKKQGNVHEVCLSSLSTAVTFYQRLGFKALTGAKIDTDQGIYVEGQVCMVKKLGRRPR